MSRTEDSPHEPLTRAEAEKLSILRGWIEGHTGGPHTMELHPTYRCNLHCSFCPYERARQRKQVDHSLELPIGRWIGIVEEAAALGVREVRLADGGEPTSKADSIEPLMLAVKKLGMRGHITTNGTKISREFARELVDIGWDIMDLSIDAPGAALHDELRGAPGTFDRAMTVLRWMVERRREIDSPLPCLKVSSVIVAQNCELIPEMVRTFGEQGADELFLLPLNPGGPKEGEHRIPPGLLEKLPDILESALDLAGRYSIAISSDMFSGSLMPDGDAGPHPGKDQIQKPPALGGGLASSACFEPWTYLQVHYDGRVGPCCNTYMGPAAELEIRSLAEVWETSAHLNSVREAMLGWKFKERCLECGTRHLEDAAKFRCNLIE